MAVRHDDAERVDWGDGSVSRGGSDGTGSNAKEQNGQGKRQTSLAQKCQSLWLKTDLDGTTMRIMAKGALAPTIALAAFQATDFAETYTTLGYLVGIVSILSFPIMPRAKFLQTILIMLSSTCLATAVALLAIYCCVRARINASGGARAGTGGAVTSGTPSPGAPTSTYNSSASAVAAIWLFVQVWFINTMRARNPALTIPGIVMAIFANVSMVYAPQFSAMSQGISFATRLLEAFLTGFAIGTGVSLLIFPMTMRQVVFKEMAGHVTTMRKLLGAYITYLESLREANMFNRTPTGLPDHPRTPQAQAMKDILASLNALSGKLTVDLTFAKREVAWGKLGPDDLQEIWKRLRSLLQPLTGLSSLTDVFERITEEYGWHDLPLEDSRPLEDIEDVHERHRAQAVQDWHEISAMLQAPFTEVVGTIDKGLAHVLYTLELAPKPKRSQEVEEKGEAGPEPGSSAFTDHMRAQAESFRDQKAQLMKGFCELRKIQLPPDFFQRPRTSTFQAPDWYSQKPEASETRSRYRRQLFLVLYMDFLLDSIAQSTYSFCKFADEKAEIKMKTSRLIVPGVKRFRKWIMTSITAKVDSTGNEEHGMNESGGGSTVYLGDAYHKRKDPEHLPPTTTLQKIGDKIRAFPRFLRSPASCFGFRVAIATLSLAIIAYLRDTQRFYVTQRLFWAQIMVTISMSPSSGQSVFSFLLRIGGTFLAMVSSYIIYYIVNGVPAGVLVFYWFFTMWGFYIILKYPKFTPVGMIYSVTNTLIIGYELQTHKIGIAVSESNGQAFYPTYELAPYRLATVAAGIFVAYFWTVLPFPMSEHGELRHDLGSSLYLLANYYSVVDSTVRVRISGSARRLPPGRENPLTRLDKARLRVFSKTLLLLQALNTHAEFLKFDIPIGGRFPTATYRKTIARVHTILNFTSLISYASQTFADMCHDPEGEGGGATTDGTGGSSESAWLRDFRRLSPSTSATSREITTLLALLSASVGAAQPLPPFVKAPAPYGLTAKLDALDGDILSVRHLVEPGYAAFACMQIATRCVGDDLAALLRDVRDLVGEMDFHFEVAAGVGDEEADEEGSTTSTKEVEGGEGGEVRRRVGKKGLEGGFKRWD